MLLCMMILVTVAVAQQFHVVVYEATPGGIMAAIAGISSEVSFVVLMILSKPQWQICSSSCQWHPHWRHVQRRPWQNRRRSATSMLLSLSHWLQGETSVIGGLALEFFKLNGQHYGSSTPIFDLEPHVARDIFLEMLSAANVTLIKSAAVRSPFCLTILIVHTIHLLSFLCW